MSRRNFLSFPMFQFSLHHATICFLGWKNKARKHMYIFTLRGQVAPCWHIGFNGTRSRSRSRSPPFTRCIRICNHTLLLSLPLSHYLQEIIVIVFLDKKVNVLGLFSPTSVKRCMCLANWFANFWLQFEKHLLYNFTIRF